MLAPSAASERSGASAAAGMGSARPDLSRRRGAAPSGRRGAPEVRFFGAGGAGDGGGPGPTPAVPTARSREARGDAARAPYGTSILPVCISRRGWWWSVAELVASCWVLFFFFFPVSYFSFYYYYLDSDSAYFLPSSGGCVAKPELLRPLSLPGQRTRAPAERQPWGTVGLRTPALSPPLRLSRPSLGSRFTSSAFPIHWERKKKNEEKQPTSLASHNKPALSWLTTQLRAAVKSFWEARRCL